MGYIYLIFGNASTSYSLHRGQVNSNRTAHFEVLRIKYVDAIRKKLIEMEKHNHLSHQLEESDLKLDEDYLWKQVLGNFVLHFTNFQMFHFFGSIIQKIFQKGFQNQNQMLQYTAMPKSKSAFLEVYFASF